MTHPGGRPTHYKPEYCEIAINFLSTGKGKIQLAAHLNIAKSVLQRWEKNHEEFKAAIDLGLTYAESKWLDKGEDNIENRDFSYKMYELQGRNRYGWSKEKEDLDKTTDDLKDAITSIKELARACLKSE